MQDRHSPQRVDGDMLLLMCVVAILGQVGGEDVQRCGRVFEYVQRRGESVGLIKLRDPGGDVEINVTIFRTALLTKRQTHFGGLKLEEDLTKSKPYLEYYLKFPIGSPLPKIAEITFNGRTICKSEEPQSEANMVSSYTHSVTGRDPSRHQNSYIRIATSSSSRIMNTRSRDREQPLLTDSESTVQTVFSPLQPSRPPTKSQAPRNTRPTTRRTTTKTTTPPPSTTTSETSVTTTPTSSTKPSLMESESTDCGLSVRPQTLMLGRREVDRGDWPWMAAVYEEKSMRFKCGGALISKKFVVTAAHCASDPATHAKLMERELVVILGKFDLSKWAENDVQHREVRKIILHPEFKDAPLRNDIALLFLESEVEYTLYVRPACLWDGETLLDFVVNETAKIVGWPRQESLPRIASVPIVSHRECFKFFGQVVNQTLCAGFKKGSGACIGDGEGGLYLSKVGEDGNLRWFLRGIASANLQVKPKSCSLGGYVIYTDVAQYTDWVREVVRTTRTYHE